MLIIRSMFALIAASILLLAMAQQGAVRAAPAARARPAVRRGVEVIEEQTGTQPSSGS